MNYFLDFKALSTDNIFVFFKDGQKLSEIFNVSDHFFIFLAEFNGGLHYFLPFTNHLCIAIVTIRFVRSNLI